MAKGLLQNMNREALPVQVHQKFANIVIRRRLGLASSESTLTKTQDMLGFGQQLEREAKIEHCIKECEELWSEQKSKTKQKRFFKSQVELRAKAETAEAGGDEVN